jgi:hypothetical protein
VAGGYQQDAGTLLARPIVRPGAPWWAEALASPNKLSGGLGPQLLALTLVLVFGVGGAVLLAVPWPAPLVGVVMILSLCTLAGLGFRAAPHHVVSPTLPKVGGVTLSGAALDLLADIESRFDYTRRLIGEIPTGIRWSDIGCHVDVLLWDAAEHAGRLAELDDEIHELRYAAPGTPQAAYRSTLAERRAEHEQAMRSVQWEAEDLARHAGNTVAAARLALARTGDRALLEVVAPTGSVIQALDGLAEAKQRLAMLSDVWSELDPRAAALSEQVEHDANDQHTS